MFLLKRSFFYPIVVMGIYFFSFQYGISQTTSTTVMNIPITILQKPVLVRLKQVAEDDFLTNVDFGKDHFSFKSEGYDNSLPDFLKTFGWKDGYLFVHRWNGCGSCHKGVVDRVYKIINGHLVELGEISSPEDAKAPGEEYKNGIFEDLYNKFEATDLTAHAQSPDVLLALREKDGKYLVDLHETWLRNKTEYFELKGKLDAFPTPTNKKDNQYESPLWMILGNAVVAKYCDKREELNESMQLAKKLLTKEEIEKIRSVLNDVFPGELSPRQAEMY
jgi:hypothetical protein